MSDNFLPYLVAMLNKKPGTPPAENGYQPQNFPPMGTPEPSNNMTEEDLVNYFTTMKQKYPIAYSDIDPFEYAKAYKSRYNR